MEPCCQDGLSEELEERREVSFSEELEEERGCWWVKSIKGALLLLVPDVGARDAGGARLKSSAPTKEKISR